jgi:predicted MFS family arabinose efflux permease
MDKLLVPTAILSGSGGAFYWVGHNVLVTNYTTKDNREIGIAILGIVQGVMTLLIPVVSGFVISFMVGNTGYRVMFGIGMAAVVAQVVVQMKLYPVEQKQHASQVRLAVKLVRKMISVKLMLGYEFIRGFRDGAFGFIMNMILFEIITDESLVGINTFLSGAASIIGSWVYGRAVRSYNRDKFTIAAATTLTLLAIPLFWVMSAPSAMLFNVATAFGSLFMFYSCNNQSYDVVGQSDSTRRCIGELLAFREGACATGRMCGLTVLLLLPHDTTGYVQSIIILTSAQVICGIMLRATRKIVDRKKDNMYESDVRAEGAQ